MGIANQNYYLVEECNKAELEKVIQRCIDKYNFKPIGGIAVYVYNDMVVYCQAMYKEDTQELESIKLKGGIVMDLNR